MMQRTYYTSCLVLAAICIVIGCVGNGCISHPQNPDATQPATILDLNTTQPSYWLSQPPAASVTDTNFLRLWRASEQACRDHMFLLDREDFRSGELTTQPLVSAQWFEPWRQDTRTLRDVEESSTATIRRTVYFNLTENLDGTFTSTPRVIVERQAVAEQRITSVTNYQDIYNLARDPNDQPHGTIESDLGFFLPERYWYVLRRDPEFERVLADDVRRELKAY
jgi:hypothetical protein